MRTPTPQPVRMAVGAPPGRRYLADSTREIIVTTAILETVGTRPRIH